MIYTRTSLVVPEGLDLRLSRTLIPFLAARGGWGIVSPNQFDGDDDAMFRRLLMGDAPGMEDALARYLESIRGEQGLSFDVSFATVFAEFGARPFAGAVMPADAARRLLPSLVDRRPIVLRGGAPKPVALARPIPATKSIAPPTGSTDAGAAELSRALAACVTDDRAPARRRRISAKKPLWAAAAALAAIAIVPSIAMRWSTSAASVTFAVSTPTKTEHAVTPAPSTFAAAALPAATRVAEKAPPLERAPIPAQPVKVAIVEPALVATVDKREAPSTAAFVPVQEVAPPPAILSPAPIAATTAAVLLAATRPGPVVARGAWRKARKAISAKGTTVASALSLPDVLKPQ